MKILISGGGIGGITAALCLAKEGHEVEVLEQAEQFAEIGAGIQLSPNCSRVLHHVGLEDALQERAFLPQGTQFRSWKSGKVISESALGQQAKEQYGFPYYHMHRGDLLSVLVEAAESQSNIALHTENQVRDCKQDNERAIAITDKKEYTGDILIGADGIHSVIRGKLWGDEKPSFTGNVAWRALVPADQLPEGLIAPMSTAWWGPHKHFVHYYVRAGTLVNCVCVVEKTGWEVESWTTPGDYDELRADFKGWHSDIQTLIDTANRDTLFKWALFDRPPMNRWGKGRITLLGDACHPTLPFMAQGAAMAIEDAAVLAACLNKDGNVEANLLAYENLRKKRTAGIQNGSRRNAKVFHLSGIAAWMRNRAASKARGRVMEDLFSYNALEAAN